MVDGSLGRKPPANGSPLRSTRTVDVLAPDERARRIGQAYRTHTLTPKLTDLARRSPYMFDRIWPITTATPPALNAR
jgi:hypothetical protein